MTIFIIFDRNMLIYEFQLQKCFYFHKLKTSAVNVWLTFMLKQSLNIYLVFLENSNLVFQENGLLGSRQCENLIWFSVERLVRFFSQIYTFCHSPNFDSFYTENKINLMLNAGFSLLPERSSQEKHYHKIYFTFMLWFS